MKNWLFIITLSVSCLAGNVAKSDLVPGVISDFQNATLQGWEGGTVTLMPDSGPLGSGDYALQLANGGNGDHFSMFNMTVQGSIVPSVSHISVDIMRPTGQVNGQIRLVLFDAANGSRWTSTTAATIVGDGQWNRYNFSVRQTDLTRVLGTGSYSSVTADLERIMFRHDPGTPSSGGVGLAGTMYFDNITAVPEPGSTVLLLIGLAVARLRRNKR